MKSKIDYLDNLIKTILENRKNELSVLTEAVTAGKQKMEDANRAIETATTAADLEGFRKAKAERELAADVIALNEARIKMLEEKELVSREEYETVLTSVVDEVGTLLAANRAKAANLLAELESIAQNDSEIINRVNPLLRKWQVEIYHDPDLMRNGNLIEEKIKRCKLSPVTTYVYQTNGRNDYREIVGGGN